MKRQGVDFNGQYIEFDEVHNGPHIFVLMPWMLKIIKKQDRMFSRRDKRRKHKRYPSRIAIK